MDITWLVPGDEELLEPEHNEIIIVQVNKQTLRYNEKHKNNHPGISVRVYNVWDSEKDRRTIYGSSVQFHAGSLFVYRPDAPFDGQDTWIETEGPVHVRG